MKNFTTLLFLLFSTLFSLGQANIVITEISYNPPEYGTDSTEYVEIYNNGMAPINLGGYQFSSAFTYTFPSVWIQPGDYLIIANNSTAMQNRFGVNTFEWSSGTLSNNGELILLKDSIGTLVDSVRYDDNSSWPSNADGGGSSLVLCLPGSDNSIGANWNTSGSLLQNIIISQNQVYGSPGTSDNSCDSLFSVSVIVNSNATCAGHYNGSASAVPYGGQAPFSFLWSNNQISSTVNNLPAGTHTVTITDQNGDSISSTVTIMEPTTTQFNLIANNTTCAGIQDGSVSATNVSSNYLPLTYQWSTGDSGTSISNLTAGTYTLWIMDSLGCYAADSIVVNSQSPDSASISIDSNATCLGVGNGVLTASYPSGTGPFYYQWSNGDTSATINMLPVGTYTVTITQYNGCIATATASITQQSPLSLNLYGGNVTCNGGTDGTLGGFISNGNAPYSWSWSTGDTTQLVYGVSAGNYSATVTDQIGCIAYGSATVTEPSPLSANINVTQPSYCYGATNGQAQVNVTGGTVPYTYLWSNGSTNDSIAGLSSGTYTVTATDSNGCMTTSMIQLNTVSPMVSNIVLNSSPGCTNPLNGNATASATGSGSWYSYSWSNGDNDSILNNVGAGIYFVTITDNLGCSTVDSIYIPSVSTSTANISVIQTISCYGSFDGQLTANTTSSNAQFIWSTGDTSATIFGLSSGWYSVTVNSTNGCSATDSLFLTQPSQLIGSLYVDTAVSCNNTSNGVISAYANGGTAPYMFNWSNGQTAPYITNLSPATYSLTITDQNGCIYADSIALSFLDSTQTFSQTIPLCSGDSIIVGTDVYYGPGTYTNTLTGSNGCDSIVTTEIINATPNANIHMDSFLIDAVLLIAEDSSSSYQWVDCDNGYTPIIGATSQTFSPTSNGNYAVILNNGTCTDTSACIDVFQIGISENGSLNNIRFYPNPAKDNITIRVDTQEKMDVIIRDITGKVVFNKLNIETRLLNIDISTFNSGVYFIEFENDNKRQIERLIVL